MKGDARAAAAGYRPDVDGLRAASIIAVVGYHADLPWLAGGFMGVDVFFVISGYLITRLLLGELEREGRINLAAFWARRVRRLLPALALVVLVTLIASAFLLSPAVGEVQALAKSAIATMLIAANLWFLELNRDYFAADDGQHPLLHAWSLSVEEQFYLGWPVLMVFGWWVGIRRGRPLLAVGVTLAVASVVSFVLAAAVSFKSTAYAFYLMPTRAWELGAGALIALLSGHIRQLPVRLAGTLSALGMAAIVLACAGAGTHLPFPIPLALLPVLGAALVITGGVAAPGSIVARMLSTRGMVTLGVASYALYLWHWPILTIGRVRDLGEPDAVRDMLLIALSVALALLTLRYVERPLRFSVARGAAPQTVLRAGAAVSLALLVAAGTVGWLAKTLPVPAEHLAARAALRDMPARQPTCHASNWPRGQQEAACLTDAARDRIIVWGDSHANHWVPALEAWPGDPADAPALEQWTLDACPPIFGATPTAVMTSIRVGDEGCREFNSRVRERLLSIPSQYRLAVIIASNWWYRSGDVRWKADEPAHSYDLSAVGADASLQALEHYLRRSLLEITSAGYAAVVMLQSPVLDHPAPHCMLRRGAEVCGISLASHRTRAERVNAVLRNVAGEIPLVSVLDPADLLCRDDECPTVLDGRVAYTDRDHLAASVVQMFGPQVSAALSCATRGRCGAGSATAR